MPIANCYFPIPTDPVFEDTPPPTPEWLVDGRIHEAMYCRLFLEDHPLCHVGGKFYSPDGVVSDEHALRNIIYRDICPYVTTNLAKKVDALFRALKNESWMEALPIETDRIHVANGLLFLDNGFFELFDFCRHRLPVRYEPNAPTPHRWLAFLNELFFPEDIPTLQEFIGYCLIPSTKGQKMLTIIGDGGEGKSRIAVVLHALLGSAMSTGSLAKVELNRFAQADLEGKLLMIDDDMQLEALPQTNHLKTIVTAELPMDLERKGIQSYQSPLFVRFLGLGNGHLRAMYDHNNGFYRRQIILTTRPKPEDRVDDCNLGEKLVAEKEGIFLWALEGLHRLRENNYHFTISPPGQGKPGRSHVQRQ